MNDSKVFLSFHQKIGIHKDNFGSICKIEIFSLRFRCFISFKILVDSKQKEQFEIVFSINCRLEIKLEVFFMVLELLEKSLS